MNDSLAQHITRLQPSETPSVFVIALNSQAVLARKQAEFSQAPYLAAPKTPVIYTLPESSHNRSGKPVFLPAGQKNLRIEPHLGIVFARDVRPTGAENALDYVRGYIPTVLYSLPNEDYYRPDIEGRCQDGFCVLGQEIRKSAVKNPQDFSLQISINQQLKTQEHYAALRFSAHELIAFLSRFTAFKAGDILCIGCNDQALTAAEGDQVCVQFSGLGSIENSIYGTGGCDE